MGHAPKCLIGLAGPLLIAAGCTAGVGGNGSTGQPGYAAPAPIPTPEGELHEVVSVVDGDTIKIAFDGGIEALRLIGIDTPETVHPSIPVECFGREASARAHELLDGRWVRIATDPTQSTRDRYGRLLVYVWREDGTFINLEMVQAGYAFEFTYDLPYAYQQEFRTAERDARESERGLWAPETCAGEPAAATPLPSQ